MGKYSRQVYYRDEEGRRVSVTEPQPDGAVRPSEGRFYLQNVRCSECGAEKPKTTRWQKYCSASCRMEAWRRRHNGISNQDSR